MRFCFRLALGTSARLVRAWTRGRQVSSNDGVFLYVGIVAIWVGFLAPAWIRRPHASEADLAEEDEASAYAAEEPAGVDPAEPSAGADAADWSEVDDHRYAPRPQYREYVRPPSAARPPAQAFGPSQSRQQMLRARRRMLTILVALCLLTGGFVVVGLVQWWICVPPIAMLVLYALLLREIALADAELAAKRATWEARARADEARAEEARAAHAWAAHTERVAAQRRREEWAAVAEPDAEIIDISSRVGDQLYDQYADAAVRAVGD